MEVVRLLWVVWRREVKMSTWARARAEERVPILRVRCEGWGGSEAEVEVEEGGGEVVDGWVAIVGDGGKVLSVVLKERLEDLLQRRSTKSRCGCSVLEFGD